MDRKRVADCAAATFMAIAESLTGKNPPAAHRRVLEGLADVYFLSALFVLAVSDFIESVFALSDELFTLAVSDFIESP